MILHRLQPWRRKPRLLVAVLLVHLLVAVLATPLALQQPAAANHSATGTWSSTTGMGTARSGHTATTITGGAQNGNVLVAGGHAWVDHRYHHCCRSDSLNTVERYDGATWTPVAPMNEDRSHHTATALPDGRVGVAGGFGDGLGEGTNVPNARSSVEVWNGTTWTRHQCAAARFNHTATLLSDGNILLVGGEDQFAIPLHGDNVEVFNPNLGTCTPTAPLEPARAYHTATRLLDGRVLVAGGVNEIGPATENSQIFTYVPGTANGTWGPTGPLNKRRQGHTATLLQGTAAQCGSNCGKVLVAGGMTEPPGTNPRVTNIAELFDPASNSWTSIPNFMNSRRYLHTATLLPNGTVLVAGGNDTVNNDADPASPPALNEHADDPAVAAAELYNPLSGLLGSWATTGSLVTARLNHEASLVTMVSGVTHVLVTGGASHNTGNYPPYFMEESENMPPPPQQPAQHVLASAEAYSTGLASNFIATLTVCGGPDIFGQYRSCSSDSSAAGTYSTGGAVRVSGSGLAAETYQIQFVPAGDPTVCTAQVFAQDEPRFLGSVSGPGFSVGPLPLPSPTAPGTARLCIVPADGTGAGKVVDVRIAAESRPSGYESLCRPNRANDFQPAPNNPGYFAGWHRSRLDAQSNPVTVTGVTARIGETSPYVFNSDPGDYVSAWSMLADSKDRTHYAQIGWWKYPNGIRQVFWAWNDQSEPRGFKFRGRPSLPVGEATEYKMLYTGTPGQFRFVLNGATVGTETTNPTYVPDEGQLMGETHTAASQMPGTPLVPETFDQSSIAWNGPWEPYNGIPGTVRAQHGQSQPTNYFYALRRSPSRLDIGDNACQVF